VDKIIQKIIKAFTSGEFDSIADLVKQSIDQGTDPSVILEEGLITGIREVGEQFRRGEVYLPEMLLSSEAWQKGMAHLEPMLAANTMPRQFSGKVIIGTVKGDIHSLGKNIVKNMLQPSGFEVIDLGEDVPASRFVEEAEKHQPDIIAVSALMTTTIPQQKEIIEHLSAHGIRHDYYVMVGGGATTEEWAMQINADAYGETAADAVLIAENFIKTRKKEGLG
jgi:5-methyltetrahydrofolate--homocysteine methyltransferase